MHPLKRISLFFGLCVVIYGVLVAPWPGVMEGYRAFFRWGGNAVFGHFGSAGRVAFAPLSSADHAKDTAVLLFKKRPPAAKGEMHITAVYTGYRPTVFFIALVLATPVPWARRWKALLLGLMLVNAFIALRVSLLVLDAFSNRDALALFSFAPFWKVMLNDVAIKVLVRAPAMHYMAPAFIWLLVAFRRGDMARLLSPPQAEGEAEAWERPRRKRRRRR